MKSKRKAPKEQNNYLDYIPMKNLKFPYEIADDGAVTIMVENTGFFNRIAQNFFKKPKVSQIHLEEMGNFIWPLIDGQRSVYEIAQMVKEHFGEKAEPLYDRLVPYMQTLANYEFILYKNLQQNS